ncbi:MAG: ComF family protein [Fibrobacteraceae bacterium]|nr:ComF family protein [Fibrobacteraceae bacterium]
MSAYQNFVRNVSNFIFGMECLGCGCPWSKLDPWLCKDCAAQLGREAKGAVKPGEDVYSLFLMRPLTRRLIHSLKYKGLSGMASYLVKKSLKENPELKQEMDSLPKPLYFVPVPLHKARYRERGYNQAEKFAAALAAVFGGKVCKWVRRQNFKVSQTKLSREQREWNVAGAFAPSLPAGIPHRGTVVVVDDVYTTGATTSACASAFGKNFPLEVKVCTLLYDQPATATADFVADVQAPWNW